jgi:hypothetical protein
VGLVAIVIIMLPWWQREWGWWHSQNNPSISNAMIARQQRADLPLEFERAIWCDADV